MATPPSDDILDQPESGPLRDASKLVIEHPLPLYDPWWLRLLHNRCLWDGGQLNTQSNFCRVQCEEQYSDWEHRTTHILLGREPLQTFFEQGREVWP